MHQSISAQLVPLLKELDAGFGSSYSAVVYGSAAREDFVPGHSDINLMLVLPSLDPAVLRKLGPAFTRWRKTGHLPPLLLTPAELRRSADAFPLEIHDLKAAYVIVRGSDPLSDITVRRADLRVALERDARGKLLRLRQGYAETGGKRDRITGLARLTVGGVLLLCRSALFLAGRRGSADPVVMIAELSGIAGFDPAALADLAAHRGDSAWRCPPERFEAYLVTVERLVGFLDELHMGDE
jgi:predicted nucleotidyltransferase